MPLRAADLQGGSMNTPRPEYPRPQMVRNEWMNLNGIWQFEIDNDGSGRERKLQESESLSGQILVPFCPESELSGVGYKGFMQTVWYRRSFVLPTSWDGKRIILHFGAVDYRSEVWINKHPAGVHRGGYSSFSFDITEYLVHGNNEIVLCAEDNIRCGKQPHGKQSKKLYSYECSYTRTTGIWQTVWLEPVSQEHIRSFKQYPDPMNQCLFIQLYISGYTEGQKVIARASLRSEQVSEVCVEPGGDHLLIRLPISDPELWEPGNPVLYDLELSLLKQGQVKDCVNSYFGMRSISISCKAVFINGKPVFQRLVLDQGFYQDGIYTAPSDEALKKDIEISMALGFNGARLHQKVFEQRFLYWADRYGYLVWGEYSDTGLDLSQDDVLSWMLPEWQEIIIRDFNSPALIVWCPLNETRDSVLGTRQRPELIRRIYETTKNLDPTRPVIDASGFVHNITDIFDVHEYEQKPENFKRMFESLRNGTGIYNTHPNAQAYKGQPYMVSEYGGTWWSPEFDPDNQMSYGNRPSSEEEFIKRFTALTNELMGNPGICGLCYTQLYDVEQEVNGLYTYKRVVKFSPSIIRAVLKQQAAVEILYTPE